MFKLCKRIFHKFLYFIQRKHNNKIKRKQRNFIKKITKSLRNNFKLFIQQHQQHKHFKFNSRFY
jgi:hypothetical protein